jgi:hypothetical protein
LTAFFGTAAKLVNGKYSQLYRVSTDGGVELKSQNISKNNCVIVAMHGDSVNVGQAVAVGNVGLHLTAVVAYFVEGDVKLTDIKWTPQWQWLALLTCLGG